MCRTPFLAHQRQRGECPAPQTEHNSSAEYDLAGRNTYTLKTGIATLSGTNLWECPIRPTERIARRSRPDIVITLNPDEAWAHPRHRGLGRLVGRLHRTGVFDRPGASRPRLFGLREHGRYAESLRPQVGDESFDRLAWSPVLKATYADDWRRATASYVSQSSHPVWFAARAAAGLLPGYGARDMIRQLNCGACAEGLGRLLRRYPAPAGLARTSPNPPAGPIKPPASGVSAMARRTHASASGCRGRPPRVAGAAAFFLAMAAACQFAPSMGNPAQGKPGATAECRACGAWQPVMGGGGEP